jgi:hypothetical protein
MRELVTRAPWQVGDRVQRLCARKTGGHIGTDGVLKTGTVTRVGRMMVQVEWDDGLQSKYDPEELTYLPIGKEKK